MGLPTNETINSTLQHRFDNELLSPDKYDSNILEVVLEKEPQFGIGITIVGGETPEKVDLGIFIKTVVPGGPADLDGRIQPGDRLLAINDQMLEGMQHAVQLIRDAPIIKLCVSHIKPPGSVRRKSYDDIIQNKLKYSKADSSDILIYQQNVNSLHDDSDDCFEDDVNNIPHSDVHTADVSTMSQIESIKSEIVESELLEINVPCNTVNEDTDSETDSDFDQAIESVQDESPSKGQVQQEDKTQFPQEDKPQVPQEDKPQVLQENKPQFFQEDKQQITQEPEAVERDIRGSAMETYEVYLTKKGGGFGLIVAGGVNTSVRHGGIYVKSFMPDGAAEIDGTIKKGDRILEINGKSLVGVTHKQAVQIIMDASECSLLVMEHGQSLSSRSSLKSSRSSPGSAEPPASPGSDKPGFTEPTRQLGSPVKEIEAERVNTDVQIIASQDKVTDGTSDKPYPFVDDANTFEVDLVKGSSGLGFSVLGVQDVPVSDPSHGLPRIKKIFPLGAAMDSGKLEAGDVILEVNGEPVKDMTHTEMDVTLQRNNDEGLGFTLTGGASRGGCYIKKIIPGPALSDGRLKPGDKLIKVNGADMTMFNHFEAVTYLHKAPSIVTIRIYREPNTQNSVNYTEEDVSEEDITQGEEEHVNSDKEIDPETESVEASTGQLEENSLLSTDESPLTTGQFSHTSSVASDSMYSEKIDSCINDLKLTLNELDNSESVSDRVYKNGEDCDNKMSPPGKTSGLRSQESVEIDSFGMNLSETGLMKIELEKPPSGELGFGLVTAEKDQQTGIFVRTITEGGVADRDGRLQVMDRIVQINDESLVGLTHKKAVAMLQNIQGQVVLTISRLSERQLDLMTPPVIMDEDYFNDDDEATPSRVKVQGQDDNDSDDEELCENENSQYIEVIEGATDSEEEDMQELVLAAEKLLADTSELDTEDIVPQKNNLQSDENDTLGGTLTSLTSLNDNEDVHTRTFNMSSLPRKLDMKIPEEVNFEWLCSCVPLMTLKNETKPSVSDVAHKFQSKLEQGDPGEEYKELRQVKLTDNCSVARQPENKLSNRFRNVLPYDYNRVCLTGDKSYINASHIAAPVGEEECHYIACQGPLPQTCEQFWQMIWEQDVSVIMMLTLDVENRKVKCHRYWPDSTETPLFVCDSQLKVSLVEQQTLEHFDIKEIDIEKVTSGEIKRVYHLNYTTWPDHGVPSSPIPILQYLQLGHVYHTSGPLLVHCSAGIGRTGALITIDIALARLESDGKCDIYEIVKDLRRQRQGMIQTKDQYILCYEACIAAMLSAVD